jgi:hypothetical protein
MLPGVEAATKLYVLLFPRYAGAVKATVADPSPAVAVPIVGVPGFLPPELAFPMIGIKHSNRQQEPKYL